MESGSSSRWGGKRPWQIAAVIAALVALGAIIALVFVGCAGEPPEAEFTATPVSGEVPVEVAFRDASSGGPDAWSWDFGDGGTSTEQNPTHLYEQAGTFRVILTVTNDEGSDDLVKPGLVTVTEPP
jgi:PKD repeat protein